MGGREFVTISYCLRTMGYCFPIVLWEFLLRGHSFDWGGPKVMMGDVPLSLPAEENPGFSELLSMKLHLSITLILHKFSKNGEHANSKEDCHASDSECIHFYFYLLV